MSRAAILSTLVLVSCAFGQAKAAPVVASAAGSLIIGDARAAAPILLRTRDRIHLSAGGSVDAAPESRRARLINSRRDDHERAAWSAAGDSRLALPVAPSLSLDLGYRFVTNEDLAADAFLAAERGSLDPDHVSHSVTIHARWQF